MWVEIFTHQNDIIVGLILTGSPERSRKPDGDLSLTPEQKMRMADNKLQVFCLQSVVCIPGTLKYTSFFLPCSSNDRTSSCDVLCCSAEVNLCRVSCRLQTGTCCAVPCKCWIIDGNVLILHFAFTPRHKSFSWSAVKPDC